MLSRSIIYYAMSNCCFLNLLKCSLVRIQSVTWWACEVHGLDLLTLEAEKRRVRREEEKSSLGCTT
jgi:hypothetical protein